MRPESRMFTGRTFKPFFSPSLTLAEGLYLLVICSLPIVWPFNFRLYRLVLPLADFIFIGATIAWLVSLVRGKIQLRWSWFYLLLGFYFVALCCSTLASANPRLSAIKMAGKVYLIGLAVLSFNLITTLGFLRRVIKAWLVGATITVVVSLLGVVLFYAGFRNPSVNIALHPRYGSLPPGNYPRIQGLFEYPAILCNYLSVSFMLALALWSVRRLRTSWFWFLSIGIWLTAIFTFTPGLGGMALSTGLWLGLQLKRTGRRNLSRLALAASVGVALAFFIAAAVTLFSYNLHGTDIPLTHFEIRPSHRALAWQTALDTFRQHPFFGRGVGMEVSSARYINPSGITERLTDAHNTYLSVAGETGLTGLLAFGAIILFLISAFPRLRLERRESVVIGICLALAFLDGFLYQSLVGSFEDTRHLWVLFGMLVASKEGWVGNNEHHTLPSELLLPQNPR